MSQKSNEAKISGPKPVTNTYVVKMLGVKMREETTPEKSRVHESSIKLDE